MIGGFLNTLAAASEPGIGGVAGLGMGVVFAGLICLVIILGILNSIFSKIQTKMPVESKPDASAVPATNSNDKMDDETVAAVSAALAEAMGRDVSAIRITSIKKIN